MIPKFVKLSVKFTIFATKMILKEVFNNLPNNRSILPIRKINNLQTSLIKLNFLSRALYKKLYKWLKINKKVLLKQLINSRMKTRKNKKI